MSKKRTSNYAADDFVEADEEAAADQGSSKRLKSSNAVKARNDKATVNTAKQVDDNGDPFWELTPGGARRVTVSEFKGLTMVNVREYYEANGKKLPGKKGISLTADQWAALVGSLPQIEEELMEKGEAVVRPDYSGRGQDALDEQEEQGEEKGGDGEREDDLGDGGGNAVRERPKGSNGATNGKPKEKKVKRNIDETSDEDEG